MGVCSNECKLAGGHPAQEDAIFLTFENIIYLKDEDSIAFQLQQLMFPEPLTNEIAVFKNKDLYNFADALLEAVFAKPVSFESFALKDYGFV